MYGKYLYGIIIGGGDTVLGIKGLVGTSLVYAIAREGISCVVSDYSGREFGDMSREELAQCLLTHQVVMEQVVKRHAVLPVKFGTVLATVDEVHDLITQGHPQFYLTLLWMQDKVEVDVVASWAGGQVLEGNGTGPEIAPAEEALTGEPEPMTGAQRRDSYLERMLGFLKPVSIEVQPHPQDSNGTVMSVAFLVEAANLEAFNSRVKQLNALFYNQIDFQVVGPLPPYSFATVEVARPDLVAIGEARRLLNLGEVTSELEVRKAYRRLAAEANSDHRQGNGLASKRLAQLHRASDLLVAYSRSQAEPGGSFLISIRRSRSDEVQPPHLVEIGT